MNDIQNNLVLGIDASRNRSGGAKAHLIGILTEGNPRRHGINEVHVWAYRNLLDALPDREWLIKHNPTELQQSLFRQVLWQRYRFPIEATKCRCSIVLNTDAGTVARFRPAITMSRDMLSYEPGVMNRFGFSKARLRLILLRYGQNRSLRDADGAIFLTQYAADVIQRSCGKLKRYKIVSHGVGRSFKTICAKHSWPNHGERRIRLLYVSNAELYKHQWVVVRAVERLRLKHDVGLMLVGGGGGRAQQLLDRQISQSDPSKNWVEQLSFVPHSELPKYLSNADLFVFASGCEAFGITLLEAMSAGLPIACSDRSCLPELLVDGGIYFDPENAESIAVAVEKLIVDEVLRLRVAKRAKELSEQYSWSRCADETFGFIAETYRNITNV
jgi:glycosyltransferase involved in cell wall biosynthesis